MPLKRRATSAYKGVWREGDRWRARMNFSGIRRSLGTFTSAESAAKAYDEAALRYIGPSAELNFGNGAGSGCQKGGGKETVATTPGPASAAMERPAQRAAALSSQSLTHLQMQVQLHASSATKTRTPKPGDRLVYVLHNEMKRKQAYRGVVAARSADRGWFDVAFDDGDNLCVLMREENRGEAWDFWVPGGHGSLKGVSASLQKVLREDAAAQSQGDAKSTFKRKGKGKAKGRRTERSKSSTRAVEASGDVTSGSQQARNTRKRARESKAHYSRKLVFKRMRTDPARETFIGVTQTQKGDRWRAQLQVQGTRHNLGTFLTANAAALAYDRAAARLLGRGVGQRNFKRVRVYEDQEEQSGETSEEDGGQEQQDSSEQDSTDNDDDDDDDDASHSEEADDDEEDCDDDDEEADDDADENEEDDDGKSTRRSWAAKNDAEDMRTEKHTDSKGEDSDESVDESDTDVPDFVGVSISSDATTSVPWRINVWHKELKKTKYLGAYRSKRKAVLAAIEWRLANDYLVPKEGKAWYMRQQKLCDDRGSQESVRCVEEISADEDEDYCGVSRCRHNTQHWRVNMWDRKKQKTISLGSYAKKVDAIRVAKQWRRARGMDDRGTKRCRIDGDKKNVDEEDDDNSDGDKKGNGDSSDSVGDDDDENDSGDEDMAEDEDYLSLNVTGVSRKAGEERWRVNMWHKKEKKTHYLGAYETKREAVRVAMRWRRRHALPAPEVTPISGTLSALESTHQGGKQQKHRSTGAGAGRWLRRSASAKASSDTVASAFAATGTHAQTRFRGVSADGRPNSRWRARIYYDGAPHTLGFYETAEDAARAYDAVAFQKHGADAKFNFPDDVAAAVASADVADSVGGNHNSTHGARAGITPNSAQHQYRLRCAGHMSPLTSDDESGTYSKDHHMHVQQCSGTGRVRRAVVAGNMLSAMAGEVQRLRVANATALARWIAEVSDEGDRSCAFAQVQAQSQEEDGAKCDISHDHDNTLLMYDSNFTLGH